MSNIVVKEVSKSFDDAEVLHDINLEFKEGHIYGFVGRNGSGKSVRMPPPRGEVPSLRGGEGLIRTILSMQAPLSQLR